MVAVVAERDIPKLDRALWRVPGGRSRRLADGHRSVEQFQHTLAPRQEAGQPGGEVGKGTQRGVKHRKVGEEGDQFPQRHLPTDHVATADIPHDQTPEAEDDLHSRGIGGVGVLDPQSPVAQVIAGLTEAVALPRFLCEGLHNADSRQHP